MILILIIYISRNSQASNVKGFDSWYNELDMYLYIPSRNGKWLKPATFSSITRKTEKTMQSRVLNCGKNTKKIDFSIIFSVFSKILKKTFIKNKKKPTFRVKVSLNYHSYASNRVITILTIRAKLRARNSLIIKINYSETYCWKLTKFLLI